MIQFSGISLSFGSQKIFEDLSFIVDREDRVGLVGRNGSGKTTLLKSIVNPSVLTKGSINIQRGRSVAYLPQDVVLESVQNVFDETFSVFSELNILLTKLKELELLVESNSASSDDLELLSEVQEKISLLGVEEKRAKTKKILNGLGFSGESLLQPVRSLSVGWKMRIVLAKLLLQEADFYLFDEPTNHLDLIAKEWFLNFLKHSSFGFILICHEKYFMDELCSKILDLERGKGTMYFGNYDDFCKKKEFAMQDLVKRYNLQQKEISQKQKTIDRFKAGTKSKMAKSMERQLDKIERIEIPPSIKDVKFTFPPVLASGKVALTVKNLSHKFADKLIFENVNFEVSSGQKVAIVAANGVGKTTLFKLIAGTLPKQTGEINFGYNIKVAIFDQDQNQVLDKNKSILENVLQFCPNVDEARIRTFLGSFLFSGEDVKKKVSVLSGGEKNRVGMVKTLLQNANLLLLDEPTNHLDIPSKEILLKALQEFSGTLLFVSHDKDFINGLATQTLELSKQGGFLYEGNFDEYLYQKETSLASQNLDKHQQIVPKVLDKTSSKNSLPKTSLNSNQKLIDKVEKKISLLERDIDLINQSFLNLTFGTKDFDDAVRKLATLKEELALAEKEWESFF